MVKIATEMQSVVIILTKPPGRYEIFLKSAADALDWLDVLERQWGFDARAKASYIRQIQSLYPRNFDIKYL